MIKQFNFQDFEVTLIINTFDFNTYRNLLST